MRRQYFLDKMQEKKPTGAGTSELGFDHVG